MGCSGSSVGRGAVTATLPHGPATAGLGATPAAEGKGDDTGTFEGNGTNGTAEEAKAGKDGAGLGVGTGAGTAPEEADIGGSDEAAEGAEGAKAGAEGAGDWGAGEDR